MIKYNLSNKRYIPTYSYGQSVYLVSEVQYFLEELDKKFTLKRIGEIFCDHVFSGTVLDFYFIFLDAVSYKKIPDIGVIFPLGAQHLFICIG